MVSNPKHFQGIYRLKETKDKIFFENADGS